ncbi:MAG: hypothetical protein K9G71_02920 [Rhodobacteraceae bacterium]|nr:hypothetical protein [Paracoccaceae bacterium]
MRSIADPVIGGDGAFRAPDGATQSSLMGGALQTAAGTISSVHFVFNRFNPASQTQTRATQISAVAST